LGPVDPDTLPIVAVAPATAARVWRSMAFTVTLAVGAELIGHASRPTTHRRILTASPTSIVPLELQSQIHKLSPDGGLSRVTTTRNTLTADPTLGVPVPRMSPITRGVTWMPLTAKLVLPIVAPLESVREPFRPIVEVALAGRL